MESRKRAPFRRRLFAHALTRGVVPPACPKRVPRLSRPRLTCWRRRSRCALACSAEQKRASWLTQSGPFFFSDQKRGFAAQTSAAQRHRPGPQSNRKWAKAAGTRPEHPAGTHRTRPLAMAHSPPWPENPIYFWKIPEIGEGAENSRGNQFLDLKQNSFKRKEKL